MIEVALSVYLDLGTANTSFSANLRTGRDMHGGDEVTVMRHTYAQSFSFHPLIRIT